MQSTITRISIIPKKPTAQPLWAVETDEKLANMSREIGLLPDNAGTIVIKKDYNPSGRYALYKYLETLNRDIIIKANNESMGASEKGLRSIARAIFK